MSTRVIYHEEIQVVTPENEFSRWQTYMLKRFHPRSIFIDSVGVIWFTYFLWHHDWVSALAAMVITRIVSLLSAMNYDSRALAETTLGKIALLHLNPMNLTFQIGGIVALLFGIWQHSIELMLAGFSIVLLGHVFGWEKIDERWK